MSTRRNAGGFSLVELMVGLLIGLLAMLAITRTMMTFEAQKRVSTGGSDAQTNGAIALYLIEREIRMAGYGLTDPSGMLCPDGINIYHDGSAVSDGGTITPVRIIDGGGSNPDHILTIRSDTDFTAASALIVKKMPNSSAIVTTDVDAGLRQADLFMVASKNGHACPDGATRKICTLMQMSQDPQTTGNGWNLQHNPGGGYPYNPANPDGVFSCAPQYIEGDPVINMGRLAYRRYGIHCDHLTEADPATVPAPYTCDNTTPVAAQVVNIQARYGIAPAGTQSVNEWVDATGAWTDPSGSDIRRIKAVRIAIVTRSTHWDKEMVSPAALALWDGGPTLALTDDERHYRYRVFETIVPLKNIIWAMV